MTSFVIVDPTVDVLWTSILVTKGRPDAIWVISSAHCGSISISVILNVLKLLEVQLKKKDREIARSRFISRALEEVLLMYYLIILTIVVRKD